MTVFPLRVRPERPSGPDRGSAGPQRSTELALVDALPIRGGDRVLFLECDDGWVAEEDRKSTRLNSSHLVISYAVFCLKKQTPSRRALSTSASHLTASSTRMGRWASTSRSLSRRTTTSWSDRARPGRAPEARGLEEAAA